MILKIKKSKKEWAYFDDVKKVNVEYLTDWVFTQCQDEPDQIPYLGVRQLSSPNITGEREIINSCILSADEWIVDSSEIMEQARYNENGKQQYWGVKIIYITDSCGITKIIVCYAWNEDVYLLNTEGKTIERF